MTKVAPVAPSGHAPPAHMDIPHWNARAIRGVISGMRRGVLTFLLCVAAVAQQPPAPANPPVLSRADFTAALVAAALDRPNHPAKYEAKYVAIPYPNGDVPPDTGVWIRDGHVLR